MTFDSGHKLPCVSRKWFGVSVAREPELQKLAVTRERNAKSITKLNEKAKLAIRKKKKKKPSTVMTAMMSFTT